VYREHTEAFIGERVVVVLPRELSFDVSTRGQALTRFDDLQIGDFVEVKMTWCIEILFSDKYALCKISRATTQIKIEGTFEKFLVDGFAVRLRDEHFVLWRT
jgi:hypothetical protein